MSKEKILYLDTTTQEMEQVLIDSCPDEFDLVFLDPKIGKPGTFAEADYLINSVYPIRQAEMDAAPKTKLIHRTGAGYDNVDVAYAADKGIPVCITPNCLDDSVAELAILHILSVYRKLFIMDPTTRRGEWRKWEYKHESFEIKGKRIGVIGAGNIGRAFIRKIRGFEPEAVCYYNRRRLAPELEQELNISYCPIDDMMSSCDIVVLFIPINPETKNIISRERIAMMKPNGVLINVSRGGNVDYEALTEALKEKRILGAGLDVFPVESFDPNWELAKLDNVCITPHIGSATVDAFRKVCRICMENITRHAHGEEVKFVVNKK
ncbi:MAG: 2-hydroxyacid dehydrogenase [Candidatus Heteroscillospira sp.]|jgi:lactate dehydrogenase-like 2-hydroxyacid dehydrogenase